MPEILPWNNAFNAGAGGGGSVGVSPMQLPNAEGASGVNSLMEGLRIGQANRSARQNLLMQQEQMKLQRERFDRELAQDNTALLVQQRQAAQAKLAGQVFQNSVDPDTGRIDYPKFVTTIAEQPQLADIAMGITAKAIEMGKIDAEAIAKRLESNEKMHSIIGMRAGILLKRAGDEQRNITTGEVVEQFAQAVAAGLPKEYASAMLAKMAKPGEALNQQIKALYLSSSQSAESIKQLTGTLQATDQGGQTSYDVVDQQPGGTIITPAKGPDGQAVVRPDVPTVADNSATSDITRGNETVRVRNSDVPELAPKQGGLNPPAPNVPEQNETGATPAPGISLGPSAETVQRRQNDEKEFRERQKLASDDAKSALAVTENVRQARSALDKFTPGSGMTNVKVPLAKVFSLLGYTDVSNALAGGDLASAELFAAAGWKSAFTAIKDLGVQNRDLSKAETEASVGTTFSIDKQKKTAMLMLDEIEKQSKKKIRKEQYLAKYFSEYKLDPSKLDLSSAEAKFNNEYENWQAKREAETRAKKEAE